MAKFQATISFGVASYDAQGARTQAEAIIDAGVRHGYVADGSVVSIEAVAEPIYTQAQADAMVAEAVHRALAEASANINS